MSTFQNLKFGTELELDAASFTGSAVVVGALQETPSIVTFNNDSDVDVFVADNSGSTKGWTMIAGKSIIVDCVTNADKGAQSLQFSKGTVFYVTGAAGTGAFRIGVLYAS